MVYGDFDTGHEKLSAFIGSRQREESLTSTKRMSPTDKRKVKQLREYRYYATPRFFKNVVCLYNFYNYKRRKMVLELKRWNI